MNWANAFQGLGCILLIAAAILLITAGAIAGEGGYAWPAFVGAVVLGSIGAFMVGGTLY